MRQDQIPDILVTDVEPEGNPNSDTMKIIRSKPNFRKTIIIGYSKQPDRSKINFYIAEGFLDVVAQEKIVTTVFQVIHLFTSKHGANSLSSLYSRRSLIAKRFLDISISSTALLMASPVMLMAILAIRMESKGPIFYRSKRVGVTTKYLIY
ncbi:MAG: sugar transferase [Bacteroidetes bacterium]|nr:sugar transferase [Bacteroidota bacterium]